MLGGKKKLSLLVFGSVYLYFCLRLRGVFQIKYEKMSICGMSTKVPRGVFGCPVLLRHVLCEKWLLETLQRTCRLKRDHFQTEISTLPTILKVDSVGGGLLLLMVQKSQTTIWDG